MKTIIVLLICIPAIIAVAIMVFLTRKRNKIRDNQESLQLSGHGTFDVTGKTDAEIKALLTDLCAESGMMLTSNLIYKGKKQYLEVSSV